MLASAASAQNASDALDASTYVSRGAKDFDETVLRFLRNEEPKVVGGVPADEGEYPWQASLLVSWIADPTRAHFCGGSVIDAKWILTASHCLDGLSAQELHVAAGTNHLDQTVRRINARRLITHRKYAAPSFDNDVALVELLSPLSIGGTIQSIALLDANSENTVLIPDDEKKLWVTGWGATEAGGAVVKDLREVDVPFVTRETCNDPLSYNGEITENMICAGIAAGGQDSCQGDSGGPLITSPAQEKPRLAGIVSWGEGCAQPGKYGVYTRVTRFGEWISACMIGGMDAPECNLTKAPRYSPRSRPEQLANLLLEQGLPLSRRS
ncbi:MAG: serine protease [Rhizobiales bacterium]|nr:serine protease [Hyphomicrobiales bacterium]